MRQKKLVIGLLVMLAVLVSGFTYAYWYTVADPADAATTGTITIGTVYLIYKYTINILNYQIFYPICQVLIPNLFQVNG